MILIPFRRNQTVADMQTADACGAALAVAVRLRCAVIASVIDGVVFTVVINHAVMSRTFFKRIFDNKRRKSISVFDLDKINAVGGVIRSISY